MMCNKRKKVFLAMASFLLSFLLVFSSPLFLMKSDAADPAPPAEGSEPSYKYNVTITFGYMSFLYDWGAWDSGSFTYKPNEASKFPSQSTRPGTPGWYNFDGINNKISISCAHTISENGQNINVEFPVSISFENMTGEIAENTQGELYSGITMECYERTDNPVRDWELIDGGQNVIPLNLMEKSEGCYKTSVIAGVGAPSQKDLYVSFSGIPKNSDGTQFDSPMLQKIGYLTFTIGKPIHKGPQTP